MPTLESSTAGVPSTEVAVLPATSEAEELRAVRRRVQCYVTALQQFCSWLEQQRSTLPSHSDADEVREQSLRFVDLFTRIDGEAQSERPSLGRQLRLKERDVIVALHAYYTLDDAAARIRDELGSAGDGHLRRLHHEQLPPDMPYP